MKLVLASNILEHPAFPRFLRAAGEQIEDAAFFVSGDLLNVFPEPGEDLEGSIFNELYGGDLLVEEMERQVETRFREVAGSRFLEPLRAMFVPTGERYAAALASAKRRYDQLLPRIQEATAGRPFYFIPGNMDYPRLAERRCEGLPDLRMLDVEVLTLDGVRIGGLGGVPNTVHPFRGLVEISPYEMSPEEYSRRLGLLSGVDVLVTHVSPAECPALDDFLSNSPARMLICRAPFNLKASSDFRGRLEVQRRGEKTVVFVRPFDHPANTALVVDLSRDLQSPDALTYFNWEETAFQERPAASGGRATGALL